MFCGLPNGVIELPKFAYIVIRLMTAILGIFIFLLMLKTIGTSVKIATSLVKNMDPKKENRKMTRIIPLVVLHFSMIRLAT